MPVKRRKPKSRRTNLATAFAWEAVFLSGRDHFGELREFGIETRADIEANARDAWNRFGQEFLREYANERPVPWALVQFGEPPCP